MKLIYLLISLFLAVAANADPVNDTKSLIDRYHSIPDQAYQLDWSHEARAKQQLTSLLQAILTEPELNKWLSFIKSTSAHSSYYSIVFDELKPIEKIKYISITPVNDSKIHAIVQRKIKAFFTESENLPDVSHFINEHKITNYTQDELDELRANTLVPEAIEYIVTSNVEMEIVIVKTKHGLRISSIHQSRLISSRLEIIMP